MTADQYLRALLAREQVDTSASSPVLGVQRTANPVIQEWAGEYLAGISPSGSFAKGTANRSGTDIDLFVCPFVLESPFEDASPGHASLPSATPSDRTRVSDRVAGTGHGSQCDREDPRPPVDGDDRPALPDRPGPPPHLRHGQP